jgi:hypothetical protein
MIRICVTIQTRKIAMKRVNLMKKYISKKTKNQSITIIPGVFWSTIYQITIEQTIATAVPRTLPINPKIDCPEVMDMPIAFIKLAVVQC